MFKVSKKGCDLPGYIKTNELRQYWKTSTEFDNYLKEVIKVNIGTEKNTH